MDCHGVGPRRNRVFETKHIIIIVCVAYKIVAETAAAGENKKQKKKSKTRTSDRKNNSVISLRRLLYIDCVRLARRIIMIIYILLYADRGAGKKNEFFSKRATTISDGR